MSVLPKSQNFTFEFKSLLEIMSDKGLAQFGDLLLNFSYSLARFRISKTLKSIKVWDKELSHALTLSKLRNVAKKRQSSGGYADCAEAIAAYAYLCGLADLNEITSIIQLNIDIESLNELSEEKKQCARTIANLLTILVERINIQLISQNIEKM